MDETHGRTSADTGPGPGPDGRGDFEPTAEPDDETFVVLAVDHLRELLAVFEPVDRNAVLLVREDEGVRARGASENCYRFDVEIAADAFDVFRAEDADYDLDVVALEDAVAATSADRVALRGRPDGDLVLDDDVRTYGLRASRTPYYGAETDSEDAAEDESPLGEYDSIRFSERFEYHSTTVGAADLEVVLGVEDRYDHLGILTDPAGERVEAFLFEQGNPEETVSFALDGDEFVSPLDDVNDYVDHTDPESAVSCRESVDEAVPPMRGPVDLGFGKLGATFHVHYDRSDAVHVDASLAGRVDVNETVEEIVADATERAEVGLLGDEATDAFGDVFDDT